MTLGENGTQEIGKEKSRKRNCCLTMTSKQIRHREESDSESEISDSSIIEIECEINEQPKL